MNKITSVNELLAYLQQTAKDMRSDTRTSAPQREINARVLENEIAAYRAGMTLTVPQSWERHYQHFNNSRDPEYADFIRLQQKFGAIK
jgi:hypothetical protein